MDRSPSKSHRRDGGFAFPCPAVVTRDDLNQLDVIHQAEGGMSLADWFAGMALQGMLASGNYACNSFDLIIRRSWDISAGMVGYRTRNVEKGGDDAAS